MDSPLVSVIIVTYNSDKYIIETLESVKNQIYPNIELIVTDDFSSDNTVNLCKDWLTNNESRFVHCHLEKSAINTGVAPNANRGIKKCTGVWVKILAGDDILLPNCIKDNIEYVRTRENVKVLFSKMIPFVIRDNIMVKSDSKPSSCDIDFFSLSIEDKIHKLLFRNLLPAPTSFILLSILTMYPYNEEFPFMEDYPEWINLLSHGVDFSFLAKETVLYRLSESSISSVACSFYPHRMAKSYYLFYYKVLINLFSEKDEDAYRKVRKRMFMVSFADAFLSNNRSSLFNRFLYRFISILVNRFSHFNFDRENRI